MQLMFVWTEAIMYVYLLQARSRRDWWWRGKSCCWRCKVLWTAEKIRVSSACMYCNGCYAVVFDWSSEYTSYIRPSWGEGGKDGEGRKRGKKGGRRGGKKEGRREGTEKEEVRASEREGGTERRERSIGDRRNTKYVQIKLQSIQFLRWIHYVHVHTHQVFELRCQSQWVEHHSLWQSRAVPVSEC